MIRHSVGDRLFAIGLASVAGFVDVVGYLELGGYFLSFMSGNTTRLGAGLAADSSEFGIALLLIALFVLGVVFGSLLGRFSRRRRVTILWFVSGLLGLAAVLAAYGLSMPAMLLVAFAMGSENTVFERDGEVAIGLTYMTGALVKLGQHIATALTGGSRTTWVWYAALWAGLASGAATGAAVYGAIGIAALWPAAAAAGIFAAIATFAWRSAD